MLVEPRANGPSTQHWTGPSGVSSPCGKEVGRQDLLCVAELAHRPPPTSEGICLGPVFSLHPPQTPDRKAGVDTRIFTATPCFPGSNHIPSTQSQAPERESLMSDLEKLSLCPPPRTAPSLPNHGPGAEPGWRGHSVGAPL